MPDYGATLNRVAGGEIRHGEFKSSRSKITTAFNKAKNKAFTDEDPDGSWKWSPQPLDAFTLGWRACEAAVAKQGKPK